MPFSFFFAVMPPNGGDGEKQPIYASVSVLKPGKITVQKMVKISILMNHDFLLAYMGIFWSIATPVFSTVLQNMTRVLKTVSGRKYC